jgi:hypothetical protein
MEEVMSPLMYCNNGIEIISSTTLKRERERQMKRKSIRALHCSYK